MRWVIHLRYKIAAADKGGLTEEEWNDDELMQPGTGCINQQFAGIKYSNRVPGVRTDPDIAWQSSGELMNATFRRKCRRE